MQSDALVKEQFKPIENNAEYRVDNSTTSIIHNHNQNNINQINNTGQTIYQPQPINQRVVNNLNDMTNVNNLQNRPVYNNQQPINTQGQIANLFNQIQPNQ